MTKIDKSLFLAPPPSEIIVDGMGNTKEVRSERDEKVFMEEQTKIKNAYLVRLRQDEQKFKAWKKDKSRVEIVNSKYEFADSENPRKTLIEIFMTYPEAIPSPLLLNSNKYDGLTLAQESKILLYPYAKDLFTGKVLLIPDHFTTKTISKDFLDWEAVRAEKPSLEDKMKRPAQFIYGCESMWSKAIFVINKFKIDFVPADHFTFLVFNHELDLQCKTNE